MANQRNLKAFVRYDGSGRVVAGSLVLRKKKPKVGRWEEILTYECCNDVPSTTTTTTTGSLVTAYSVMGSGTYANSQLACDAAPNAQYLTMYSTSPSIDGVTSLYFDEALTNIYESYGQYNIVGVYAGPGGIPTTRRYFQTNDFGVFTNFGTCSGTTTTTTTVFVRSENGFSGPGPQAACAAEGAPIMVYYTANNLDVGVTLYTDSGLTTPYNPNTFGQYIRLYFNAQYQVCTMNGSTIQSYTAC